MNIPINSQWFGLFQQSNAKLMHPSWLANHSLISCLIFSAMTVSNRFIPLCCGHVCPGNPWWIRFRKSLFSNWSNGQLQATAVWKSNCWNSELMIPTGLRAACWPSNACIFCCRLITIALSSWTAWVLACLCRLLEFQSILIWGCGYDLRHFLQMTMARFLPRSMASSKWGHGNLFLSTSSFKHFQFNFVYIY